MLVLVTGLQGTGKSTIAERCAGELAAPLFAWDWCMAALTPFESLQAALRETDRETYRAIGWAMLFQAARAQLRRGMSVVLDGMARDRDVRATRELAGEVGVAALVVHMTCDDLTVQRARIESRRREIPGWHELTWEQVARSQKAWVPPSDVDLTLDSTRSIEATVATLIRALPRE